MTERGQGILVRPARPEDAALLLQLFAELAEYEQLSDLMRADERKLSEALFGQHPLADALIAERDGQPAGYALYFTTFSSFLASPGIWLEDLFVRPAHRRFGVGRRPSAVGGYATGSHNRDSARGDYRLRQSAPRCLSSA